MFGVLLDVLSHGDVLVHSDVLAHGDVLALGVHLGAAALVEVGVPRSTSESLGVPRSPSESHSADRSFPGMRFSRKIEFGLCSRNTDTLLSQI